MYINQNTGSNQSVPAPGLLLLTAEQEQIYLQYNGFIRIVSTDPVEIEPDVDAWEAWKAAEAEQPQQTSIPTPEDRIAALEAAMLELMRG